MIDKLYRGAHGWLLLCVIAAAIPGCASRDAKILPSLPPLEVPAPPPRVVIPIATGEEVQIEPPPAPPPEEPPRPQQAPRPRATGPVEPPRTTEEPPKPVPPPAAAPAATLQTTPAAEEGEVVRGIRATMARASNDLSRINYQALNADARTQYDTAKRFIQQADDAIRLKNLPFAKNLADKAATLAVQLSAR